MPLPPPPAAQWTIASHSLGPVLRGGGGESPESRDSPPGAQMSGDDGAQSTTGSDSD